MSTYTELALQLKGVSPLSNDSLDSLDSPPLTSTQPRDKDGFQVPDIPAESTRSSSKRDASKSVSSVDEAGTRTSK